VLRFYRDQYQGRIGKIFVESVFGAEKWASLLWGLFILALACLTRPVQDYLMSTWEGLPVWVVPVVVMALVVVLFVRGLLKENFEKVQEVQKERDALKRRLEAAANLKAAKELLGAAMREGEKLKAGSYVEDGERILVSQERVETWIDSTRDLIEAAFDKEEGRRFMNSEGYEPEKRPPWREVRIDPYRYHLTPRLQRLDQLLLRASELSVDPDFDPDEWRGR
jgi:hypothetical protein